MRKYQCCIAGYAGCGNLGDDAVLQGFLHTCAQKSGYDRRRIVALTGQPQRDRRRFGIRCVWRRSPIGVLLTLLRSEELLCGGGSLLQNTTGKLSLFYYLTLLRLARLCGCRVSLLAAGIGPVEGKFSQRQMVAALKHCRKIELRDAQSARFLQSLGVDPAALEQGIDPAFFLPFPPPARRLFLKKEVGLLPNDRYFCIVVHASEDFHAEAQQAFVRALGILCASFPEIRPLILLFDAREDATLARTLSAFIGAKIPHLREPSDALSLIGGAECVISTRLHPLIFAHRTHTPALAFSPANEPKLRSFCRESGMICLEG